MWTYTFTEYTTFAATTTGIHSTTERSPTTILKTNVTTQSIHFNMNYNLGKS